MGSGQRRIGAAAARGEMGRERWGCKGHNQSNKLNARHYTLKTAFSTVQINDPRLYQVNYLMHN